MKKGAVLMTCYNRYKTTAQSIQSIINSNNAYHIEYDFFIVDDCSPDKSGEIIKREFPEINLIEGTGSLYWNGGMRLAWQQASQVYDYDFYIWLNDDTNILPNGLDELLDIYHYNKKSQKEAVIFGFCSSDRNDNIITYGGIYNRKRLFPNGKSQKANLINGNIVLVPKTIFHEVGSLSDKYTHGMGDYDYSLRVIEKGFECKSSKSVIAECNNNIDYFQRRDISFKKKIHYILNNIRNKNPKFLFTEFVYFRQRHFGESRLFILLKYFVFFFLKALRI